eukprot:307651-Alexandrium_andersonii.AAC.1
MAEARWPRRRGLPARGAPRGGGLARSRLLPWAPGLPGPRRAEAGLQGPPPPSLPEGKWPWPLPLPLRLPLGRAGRLLAGAGGLA